MPSATELAEPKISAFIPISHKFSPEKRKVEFGTRPVLVVAENNVPQAAASAECVRKQGKERDKCWIVLSRGLGRNGWNCCCDSQQVTKVTFAFHWRSGRLALSNLCPLLFFRR